MKKEDCIEYVCEKEDPLKRYQTYHRIQFDEDDDSVPNEPKPEPKSTGKSASNQREEVSAAQSHEKDPYKACPVARDALGYYSWNLLHTMAAYYPEKPSDSQKGMMKQFITSFAEFYPCKTCSSHFKKDIQRGKYSYSR